MMAKKYGNMPTFSGIARPEIMQDATVYEAALARIRWVFDEFNGKVVVSNSGGKDSTVVVELAAMVAKERGELPLRVLWLDQETEYQSTVDYQRYLMYERPDIDFWWYQVPFELENSTNHENPWLNVWGEGEEWVREKEPNSIHENTYGETRFHELLHAIFLKDFDRGWGMLDGLRADESRARRYATMANPVYKYTTWSGNDGTAKEPRYRFHPIYDWKIKDIWKAIHDHDWTYNKHYDHQYSYGVPTRAMRVSNYHHEGALIHLQMLQELEPETWEAATKRLKGISTQGHIASMQYPKKLPYMFKDWDEYARHLIENLPTHQEHIDNFYKQYDRLKRVAYWMPADELAKQMVKIVIDNDLYGTSIGNYLITVSDSKPNKHKDNIKRRRDARKK